MESKNNKIEVSVNGRKKMFPQKSTVGDIIKNLNINRDNIVVEHNKTIVKKDSFGRVFLNENDSVEIISFVGGG